MKLLLLSIALCGWFWIILVPLWHFPDEQAHSGQVAFFAQKGRMPAGDELDLNEEIYLSEIYLSTDRDNLGKNRFTHNPQYRIDYSSAVIGIYEERIRQLTTTGSQNKFVHREATRYPILYYVPAGFIWKIFSGDDLFIRVFLIRSFSLILYLGNIIFIYRLGRLLFCSKFHALTLTALVGFQPMMIFSNAGVNSDALGNLFFTVFLYLSTRNIINGLRLPDLLFLLSVIILSIVTKPQFTLTIPLTLLMVVFIVIRDINRRFRPYLISFLLIFGLGGSYLLYRLGISTFALVDDIFKVFNLKSYLKFTKEYTLSHTFSEVLPWYWGIYNWLGVTYPRWVHRIINRILIISVFGIFVAFYWSAKKKLWLRKRFQAGIFLVFSSLIYFGAISVYDWMSWYTSGFQLGVQGRYFFPLISSHMALLLVGWLSLFLWNKSLVQKMEKLLAVAMVVLNFIALKTVAAAYYNVKSLGIFLNQASQYKPFFAKYPFSVIWFLLYCIVLAIWLRQYFLMKR